MAAGFLGLLLVLGLVPAGGSPLGPAESAGEPALQGLPAVETPALPVPVGVAADPAALSVGVEAPLPLGAGTRIALCDGCLGLGLQAGPDAASAAQPAAASPGPSRAGIVAAVEDAPPEAVAAGSSVLALGLAAAAWLARAGLGSLGLGSLFSRIEDGDLARHPMRRQALDFIAANPGATVQDVRRALGLAWGTTVYHLGRLEKAGQVAVRHVAGRRGHWPLGQAPRAGDPAGTGAELVRLVRERPGLSQLELARLAGVGAPAACKQLRRLEEAGLVVAQRAGRSRQYVPALAA